MRPKTLLVDDESGFVSLLAERLEARGFPVSFALDAASGLAELERTGARVVVLDVNLPDRGGLEVLEEIKERWPLVQVVMLTGQSDLRTAVRGMKLGALDYLVKPVDLDRLVQAIESAGRRGASQEESLRMIETGKLAALGRLAEGVAHEINNPVNIIMQKAGWAGELLDEPAFSDCPGVPEVKAELEAIVRQSRRCRDIVSKLMSVGGRVDPRGASFDPGEVMRSVAESVGEHAAREGVAVTLDIQEGVQPVTMPRGELSQVLTLLAENALDAMAGTGGGTLSLTLRQSSDGEVVIEVGDTGPGVPPELADRIFEPFYSTKDVGKGSGLGLPICHGVMQSLGGSVELVDKEPPGAVFAVTLPKQRS